MDGASLWMIVALVTGLYVSWTIGASDAPNTIAPAVAAGALPFWWALLLAAAGEALGAALGGGAVSETLSVRLVRFDGLPPQQIAVGMVAALAASGLWLHAALLWRVPVSTTQSVVGGLVGAAFGLGAGAGVDWGVVSQVGAAWIIAPALAAGLAYALVRQVRRTVPLAGARLLVLGLLVGGAVCGVSLGLGMGELWAGLAGAAGVAGVVSVARSQRPPWLRLHVLGASYLAFAHGSNDAANAVAPLAVVHRALRGGGIDAPLEVTGPMIVLAVTGIVIGLLTYGYRVIATVGRGIAHLTPMSGCLAVLAAAWVTVGGSALGLPLSTTHVILGSLLGVAAGRGLGSVSLPVLRGVALTWVVTAPVTAGLAALIAAGLRASQG